MVEIIWTDIAKEDLNAIFLFISRDSPKYAEIQIERFFERMEILFNYPYAGRQVKELNDF